MDKYRRPSQRYIYFIQESPVYDWMDYERHSSKGDSIPCKRLMIIIPSTDFFNWTMTYRDDSDIRFPW